MYNYVLIVFCSYSCCFPLLARVADNFNSNEVYIYFYAFGWFVRTENDKCAPNICRATTGKGCPGACQKD